MISVIVPVYNVKDYLRECIDSILGQSYQDFELILVDDGSSDGSELICDEYSQKDNRIKTIHKKNNGVSSARNTGIENAAGEWITFVDSDDLIKHSYLENLFSFCSKEIDLAMGGLIHKGHDYERYDGPLNNGEFKINSTESFMDLANLNLITSPVSKLYRTKIIKRHQLTFDKSLRFGEDRKFNLMYIEHVSQYTTAKTTDYVYRDNENSLTHSVDYIEQLGSDIDYCETFAEILERKRFFNTTSQKKLAHIFLNCLNDKFTAIISQQKPSFRDMQKTIADFIHRDDRLYDELCLYFNQVNINPIIKWGFIHKYPFTLTAIYNISKFITR